MFAILFVINLRLLLALAMLAAPLVLLRVFPGFERWVWRRDLLNFVRHRPARDPLGLCVLMVLTPLALALVADSTDAAGGLAFVSALLALASVDYLRCHYGAEEYLYGPPNPRATPGAPPAAAPTTGSPS